MSSIARSLASHHSIVVAVDIAWGMVLSCVVSAVTFLLATRVF